MNQGLVRFIERNHGKVIATRYSGDVKMIAPAYLKRWLFEGRYLEVLWSKALLATFSRLEKTYQTHFAKIPEKFGP